MQKLQLVHVLVILALINCAKAVCTETVVATCEQETGCGWFSTTAVCVQCNGQSKQKCLDTEGCVHQDPSTCANDPCSSKTNVNTCATETNCGWGLTATCTSCGTRRTSTDCSYSDGCLWANSVCGNDDCSLKSTLATCQSVNGCGFAGTCSSCILETSIQDCNGITGCFWQNSECENDKCSSNLTVAICQGATNCGWTDATQCTTCSAMTSMDTCNTRFGCLWGNNVCGNDPCSVNPVLSVCQSANECGWNVAKSTCITCSLNTSSGSCLANNGCVYVDDVCMNDPCSSSTTWKSCGVQDGCGWATDSKYCGSCNLVNTQVPCDSQVGCYFMVDKCGNDSCSSSVTATSCSSRSNCGWNTQCTTCAIHNSQNMCETQQGCVYTGSICGNDPCSSNVTLDTCQTSNGCGWVKNQCSTCSIQTAGPTCNAQPGCIWKTDKCENDSCSQNNGITSCQSAGECGWGVLTQCISCSLLTATTCNMQRGCLYSGSVCGNDPCSAKLSFLECSSQNDCGWSQNMCSSCSIQTSSQSCSGQNGCLSIFKLDNVTFDKCENDSCSLKITLPTCESQLNCGWDGQTCGTCQIIRNSAVCNGVNGCIWDSGECKNDSCSVKTKVDDCAMQKNCGWADRTQCVSCSTQILSIQCVEEQGCNWNGNACVNDPCSTNADALSCQSANGCGWSGTVCGSCNNSSNPRECEGWNGCLFAGGDCANDSCSLATSLQLCQQSNGCGWSSTYCGSCAIVYDKTACQTQNGCYWVNNIACVNDPCSSFGSVGPCANSVNCGWNADTLCATCSIQATAPGCNKQSGCLWKVDTCLNDSCSGYYNLNDCYSIMECGWSGTYCQACQNYATSTLCTTAKGCLWDTKCVNDPASVVATTNANGYLTTVSVTMIVLTVLVL